jgi:hypothetical protein
MSASTVWSGTVETAGDLSLSIRILSQGYYASVSRFYSDEMALRLRKCAVTSTTFYARHVRGIRPGRNGRVAAVWAPTAVHSHAQSAQVIVRRGRVSSGVRNRFSV